MKTGTEFQFQIRSTVNSAGDECRNIAGKNGSKKSTGISGAEEK